MNLNKYFTKGQQFETALSASSLFSKDSGLHLMSYKVEVGSKNTVIDNLSVYGSTVLVLEAKNYTYLEGVSTDNFWKGRGTRNKFTIPSTLKQNLYHVKLLKQYLLDKGLKDKEFKILHYIIIPDTCDAYVDYEVGRHLLFQSELTSLKETLATANPQINEKLAKAIKEGLI